MAIMEILSANLLNTTSMVAVDSAVALAKNLFDRNTSLKYTTSGYNSATTTDIRISFTAATIISHVLLQNHNLKTFSIFYDLTTTNQLFSTTTNSITNSYISFNTTTVNAITLRATETFPTSVEKFVGELVIANRKLVFERAPNFKDYNPSTERPRQMVHTLADGGVKVYNVRDKFKGMFAWQYITTSFRDGLKSVFDAGTSFYFVSTPTTTVWDGEAFECDWIGNFNFNQSANDASVGWGGKILIQQTSGA